MDRDEAIRRIRAGLKRRSGKTWTVKGGHGTAWGWITVLSPPARRSNPGGHWMREEEARELGELLGLGHAAHAQGESIPASAAFYAEYVDRAEGRKPAVTGTIYWD